MHRIEVRPVEGAGWTMQAAEAEPVVFRSGAKAEASARRLARRLADAGQAAEITIRLRDGTLAARFREG